MVASSKQFLVPAGTAGPVGGGYSHEVSAGGVVDVAGQMHRPVGGGAAPTSSEPRSAPSTLRLEKLRTGTSCALARSWTSPKPVSRTTASTSMPMVYES